jgi:hypothetical protein
MLAFVMGWTKNWSQPIDLSKLDETEPDLFRIAVMREVQGKDHEEFNKRLAERFGEVVTKVVAYQNPGGWVILDKHTKKLLHKDLKNKNEVETVCKTKGYIR